MSDKSQSLSSVQGTRWAFMQPFDIYSKDGSGEVYLHRVRVLQTPWFGIYLHDINLPDGDRDPHDHPWTFWSIILRGGYTEGVWRDPSVIVDGDNPGQGAINKVSHRWSRSWKRWTIHKMDQRYAHGIATVEPGTKTLIITGPRRRNWGFWTHEGWVPWQDYVEEGDTSA